MQPSQVPRRTKRIPGTLTVVEEWWRDQSVWLQERGYRLRPRFQPDWSPSWVAIGRPDYFSFEDGLALRNRGAVMDAIRVHDNRMVCLKQVKKSFNPHETEIATYFSAENLSKDKRNHCIPVYEVLSVPNDENMTILVMPFGREACDIRFRTVGEVIDFLGQMLEGLQFMHQHRVAHRDCCDQNMLMDTQEIYPNGFHPIKQKKNQNFKGKAKHYSRTEKPPRYYFIDFGFAMKYDPDTVPLGPIWEGGDKSVPEYIKGSAESQHDPFAVDVYTMGNLMREHFLTGSADIPNRSWRNLPGMRGFDMLRPLVNDMVKENPAGRPNMDEVVARFTEIRQKISWWKLRSRPVPRNEFLVATLFREIYHVFWTARRITQGLPAIPSYSTVRT